MSDITDYGYKFIYFLHNNLKRIVIAICLMFVIGIIILGVGDKSTKVSANTHNEKNYKCIEICENDTLWSIAEEYISEEYEDVEDYISEVKYINNLTSDKIYCGATLVIPYYAPPM